MIRSTIRTHVRRLAGESSAQFWTNAELNDNIHLAEQYVGQACLLPETIQTFRTVASTREYTPLGAGTIHIKHADWNGQPLTPIDYQDTRHTTEKTGNPTHFYLRYGQGTASAKPQIVMGLFPTPSSAQTTTCQTTIEAREMSADSDHSDIPDTWMWAVIMFAAMIAKFKEKEFNEVRAMAMDTIKKLVEFQTRTATAQAQQYMTIRDEDDHQLNLAHGRIWIP